MAVIARTTILILTFVFLVAASMILGIAQLCKIYYIINFGPISTKLGGIVRTIKKMTQKDNGPGPGRNYGETGVFTFGLVNDRR